jgi:hypothetical protein
MSTAALIALGLQNGWVSGSSRAVPGGYAVAPIMNDLARHLAVTRD